MNNWFQIGIIVKPQGIRGELRVLPTTDDPSRFDLLKEIMVKLPRGQEAMYKLTSARQHKGLVLLRLEGIDDRNTAETLVRGTIHIPPEEALPLDTDEYYVRDLVGIRVEAEDGEVLGAIKDVFATGANDVYIIEDANGESFMIPAIKDVVRNVSMADGIMVVRLMDGMRELKA